MIASIVTSVQQHETMPVVVICGTTATGKTELSLSLAKVIDGEIISADSRLVYRGMNIGTAKPTSLEMATVPHHLIDIIEPDEPFSLYSYQKLAYERIQDCLDRKKVPILVGGTGLYLNAVVDGYCLHEESSTTEASLFDETTTEEIAAMLKEVDPMAFAVVDTKNRRRVVRALTLAQGSLGSHSMSRKTAQPPPFTFLQYGVQLPRPEIYARIEKRVETMIADGLVDEVRKLSKRFGWDIPSMSAIGYKQIGMFLRNECSFDTAVELLKRDTRRYAKRQITWFKRDERIVWLS